MRGPIIALVGSFLSLQDNGRMDRMAMNNPVNATDFGGNRKAYSSSHDKNNKVTLWKEKWEMNI